MLGAGQHVSPEPVDSGAAWAHRRSAQLKGVHLLGLELVPASEMSAGTHCILLKPAVGWCAVLGQRWRVLMTCLWPPVDLLWDREVSVAWLMARGMADSLQSSCSCSSPSYCGPAPCKPHCPTSAALQGRSQVWHWPAGY